MCVHLPEEWKKNQDDQVDEDLANLPQKQSKLDAYFELNREDKDAHNFTYCQIPEHYAWQGSESKWRKNRKQAKRIGRMYFVPPTSRDLFHLRY